MNPVKKPTPPTGSDALSVWVRTVLLPYLYSLEITSIFGGRKKSNPSGGFSLILEPGQGGGGEPTPFAIYATDAAARKFKVREGYVTVKGDDFVPTNISTEFTLPAAAKVWFYLTVTSSAATIATTSDAAPYDWSVNKIPLGWVNASVNPPEINQRVRDHIFVPCA